VRHEWYQNSDFVIFAFYAKKVESSGTHVDFGSHKLSVTLQLAGGQTYKVEIETTKEIVPAESFFTILSTKVEIKLKKAATHVNWHSL